MLTAVEKRRLQMAEYYQKNKEKSRLAGAEWKKNNPEKVRLKNRKLQVLKTYGMNWESYVSLYNQAEGRCQICSAFVELAAKGKGTTKAACVDHCHETGEVRGILCRACNVGIGHLGDSKERIWNAYKYLGGS